MTTKLLLILGPTGVGKSTVIHELQKIDARYTYISPYTTRASREEEVDKVSVSLEEFKKLERAGRFVVVNQLYGAYYGTPRDPILEALKRENFPLIDWPIQQLGKMEASFPDRVVAVYLEPPSFQSLKQRFTKAGSRDVKRLASAENEYKNLLRGEFEEVLDYRVINKEGASSEAAMVISKIYQEAIKEHGNINSVQVKMKKDRFLRERGGKATMLDIHCSNCDTRVMQYQKDGIGNLIRCYLNRILSPPVLEKLQKDPNLKEPKDMPNLVCPSCQSLLGTPMKYSDGRLAFRLRPHSFYKQKSITP